MESFWGLVIALLSHSRTVPLHKEWVGFLAPQHAEASVTSLAGDY
jgi:hypothetical protein